METYNLASLTKKIYQSHLSFFTLRDLRNILEIKHSASLYKVITKLLEAGIIIKIERGKYLLADTKVNDYTLANFIYQPSYVSFESALNFYGILSQFPYEITSVTTKKTVKKVFEEKVFSYAHIQKKLFWGYENRNGFLIALPEKALLDQLYFFTKGYKGADLDEYDLTVINKKRFKAYLNYFHKTKQFKEIIKILNHYFVL